MARFLFSIIILRLEENLTIPVKCRNINVMEIIMSNTMRIESRTNEENYNILKKASDTLGMSLGSFMLSSALEKATQALMQRRLIMMTEGDQIKFSEEILNPKPMNEKLLEAMKLYESQIK